MIKLLLKGLIFSSACLVLGYLILRNKMKVNRIEKMCDTLRDDQRLLIKKALDCDKLLTEYECDTNVVYNKFRPLCYQVELGGDQTIFLCKSIDEKAFFFVTLWGDSKLLPFNYKLEINRDANKIKIFGQNFETEPHKSLMTDFSRRLIKYCGV